MGWSNYVIVEDWKMIIETHREVGELEDCIKESLDKMMINHDIDIDICMSDLKVSDITVKDLCVLSSAYDNASSLAGMGIDKLFLYWLDSKNIKYDIKSEFNVDLEEYKEKGYRIIRKWKYSDDDDDSNKGDS